MKRGYSYFKPVQFTPYELSEIGFAIYSDFDIYFWLKGGCYFYSVGYDSKKIRIGTLNDVEEFLLTLLEE